MANVPHDAMAMVVFVDTVNMVARRRHGRR
jgi:hypothetical protein